MRKHSGTMILSLLATLLLAAGTVGSAAAEVNVNVNIGPPPIAVAQPPEMVLVPGSRVYFVPEVNYDVFFYNGYWWSPRGDRWYRARDYSGPWRPIPARIVPPPVHRVPKDYRRVYMHERHIPYGQWRREHNPGRHGGWHERGGHGEHRGRDGHGPSEHGGGEHGRGEHGDRGRHGGRD